MEKEILVSIITVSYNSEKTIRKTIESVLNQTYTNIEYIIIDGKSTDSTIDIVKEYEMEFSHKKITYKWVSEKDNGIYDAMNKGIELSQGELIGIINSDDNYEIDAVEHIVQAYNKDSSYDVYHGLLKYYNSGKLHMIRGSNSDILKNHMIEHPACFVKKDIYRELGMFDCSFRYVADYDFLCKVSNHNKRFYLVDSILASFYDGGLGSCVESRIEALKIRRKYKFINRYIYYILFLKCKLSNALKRTIK